MRDDKEDGGCEMTLKNSKYLKALHGILLLLVVCMMSNTVDAAVLSLEAECGIKARIHTPTSLAPWLEETYNGRFLTDPQGVRLELLSGVEDPRLKAGNIQEFVPLDSTAVAQALASMRGININLTVDVYILPTPPAEAQGSFARHGAIYLSPGTGEVARETIMHLVTHELGHVLTWAYFDNFPEHWDRYLQIRGLDSIRNGPQAMHRDRAREILAEDIRFLFGGPEANSNGRIENTSLVLPDQVDGLADELTLILNGIPAASVAQITKAFPNPFNPQTTIEMLLDENDFMFNQGRVDLRITDIRGRVVRHIESGRFENGRVSVVWNGRDDMGGTVSSGRYFYTISVGQLQGRGALTLVR
jgi:FlgD Ig-like domain